MAVTRAKKYHLTGPPIGFVWVKAARTFEPTDWGLAITANASTYGKAEGGRRHPYEEGKNQGKAVSGTTLRRILENLAVHREGRLVFRMNSQWHGTTIGPSYVPA